MPTIKLIAIGRMKSGALKDAYDEYVRRLSWKFELYEIDIRGEGARQTGLEHQALAKAIDPRYPLIALDERGKTMTSTDFAKTLQNFYDRGEDTIQFIIGGADGLSDELRGQARHLLSFGAMTWPHMLVRVMIAEQLYRAETILAGHPYHRE